MKIRLFLAAITACVTIACTTTGQIPTATFNDKAAIGIEAVTTARKAATALFVAKKITVEQDQVVQAQLDLVRKGIEVAKSLQANDPTNASAQLVSALAQLDALKAQTGVPK